MTAVHGCANLNHPDQRQPTHSYLVAPKICRGTATACGGARGEEVYEDEDVKEGEGRVRG